MKGFGGLIEKKWLVLGCLVLMLALTSVSQVLAADLSVEEEDWLVYMREEEKLARDVYLLLYDQWQLRIFNNISQSEQTHMDAIKTLLDRYGIADPAAGKGLGEFSDEKIQDLYDELIERGSKSVVDALEVGLDIETTDMVDLTDALKATAHKDIRTVYENLLRGSANHLKAFVSNLSKY